MLVTSRILGLIALLTGDISWGQIDEVYFDHKSVILAWRINASCISFAGKVIKKLRVGV